MYGRSKNSLIVRDDGKNNLFHIYLIICSLTLLKYTLSLGKMYTLRYYGDCAVIVIYVIYTGQLQKKKKKVFTKFAICFLSR